MNAETLLILGFNDVGLWRVADDRLFYELDGDRASVSKVLLDAPNALYAFVTGDRVHYIGKTTRSVRRRFTGYCKPGRSQTTNIRCNANIKEAIKASADVRILVFAPISHLRYLDFEINLAAGLEDSLIRALNPPWNGREKAVPISEEAERERADETAPEDSTRVASPPVAGFKIKLGSAYYEQGLINPGAEASAHLGNDGEPIQILFDDEAPPVLSRINRTANSRKTVRVVGQNRLIAEWFQQHFQMGDIVDAQVLDTNRIMLKAPPR